MAVLSRQQYRALLKEVDIPFSACLNHEAIKCVIPGVTTEAIVSLMHRNDVEREKKGVSKHIRKGAVYGARYLRGHDILDISWDLDFSPCWVMRLVLSHVLGIPIEDTAKLLKAPARVRDMPPQRGASPQAAVLDRLADDCQRCVHADRCASPYVAIAQRLAGAVHERRLEEALAAAGVPFVTEDVMRRSGCEKTPDILLQVPILLKGHLVNWIDSKAMFGDDQSHNENALKQYGTYVNRFGAGAVVYWFGFVQDLQSTCEDVVLLTSFDKGDSLQIV